MDEQALIERYVEPSPYRAGAAEARLRDYGVSVWALVAHYQAAGGDIDRVAADYELPRKAVQAALAYYRRHKASIDARIADHVAAFM
ncbi:MAG: DUF433 domain-containing protein [Chloroflexi bacterium]|nr:DUF433 domain-containing protein [Chloroflexota bacterium]